MRTADAIVLICLVAGGVLIPFLIDVKSRVDRAAYLAGLEPPAIAPQLTFSASACPETCTITNGPGGDLDAHLAAADGMVVDGRRLVVDGTCVSACTYLVDRMHALGGDVCLTRRAVFWVHRPRRSNAYVTEFVDVPYSAPMAALIESQGGLPDYGYLMLMPGQLHLVYPACAG